VTPGFGTESLNQELKIAKLLAKLPDRGVPDLAEHEEPAPLTDQECERPDHVAVGVGHFACAGEVEDGLAQFVGRSHGRHCSKRRGFA
jgi:hypothetical protein